MAAVNAERLERLSQSIQDMARAVSAPFAAVARFFTTVATDTYQLAMRAPYDQYFSDRGYQKCQSTYPLLCYTKNSPGVAAYEEDLGPAPHGLGDRTRRHPAEPEVSDTASVNLARGFVIFTTCTDRNCTVGQVQVPLNSLKISEPEAAEGTIHVPHFMKKEF